MAMPDRIMLLIVCTVFYAEAIIFLVGLAFSRLDHVPFRSLKF